jgi:uncharacterized protein YndB with AHSA1/START domain
VASTNEISDIHWRLHLSSPPEEVFKFLSTDDGRARFWAESAIEHDGHIDFLFPNGLTWRGKILENSPHHRFRLIYFDGTHVSFKLASDGSGGTDLRLVDSGVPPSDYPIVYAGWASVLMSLKAAVDFGVDLRSHDSARTWDQGYVDN